MHSYELTQSLLALVSEAVVGSASGKGAIKAEINPTGIFNNMAEIQWVRNQGFDRFDQTTKLMGRTSAYWHSDGTYSLVSAMAERLGSRIISTDCFLLENPASITTINSHCETLRECLWQTK